MGLGPIASVLDDEAVNTAPVCSSALAESSEKLSFVNQISPRGLSRQQSSQQGHHWTTVANA